MTSLGKSLIFYLRYPAEMYQLYERPEYEDEAPDMTDLEGAEHIREMTNTVGAAAYQQAADFLKACAMKIEDHFRALGNVKFAVRAAPKAILKHWTWYARCEVASVPGGWFWCGVSILKQSGAAVLCANAKPTIYSGTASPYDVGGTAVPWLWRRGGRSWDQRALRLLGDRAHSGPGGGLVEGGGSVALPTVPLLHGALLGFDVDRDPLVDKVVQVFAAIRTTELEAISRELAEVDPPEFTASGSAPVPDWPSLAKRWADGEHPPSLASEVNMKWEVLYASLVQKGLLAPPAGEGGQSEVDAV